MRHQETSHCLVNLTAGTVLAACWLAASPASAQEPVRQKPDTNDQAAELARANGLDEQMDILLGEARYDEAISLMQEVLAIREKLLGETHPDVARSLDTLGVLYLLAGDYDKASPLLERALTIREEALGPEHADVAQSLNNLAGLYNEKGDYGEALRLYKRASRIQEKALGPDDPRVAMNLSNLAGLHDDRGEYDEALRLYQRALSIQEKAVGPNHPDVAVVLNNLAVLHETLGEYAAALLLHERALAIWEEALGPDHPYVAQSLNNRAAILQARGEYDEALVVHERALAIREKAQGPDHPDVAVSLNNLAHVYLKRGEDDKALPLHLRALAIRERALGPEHPHVAITLNSLASLHSHQGEHEKALTLYERALAIREKALGPVHPDVAQSLNNLAVLFRDRGEYDKALPLQKRALSIQEKILGPEHPHVAFSLNNLAMLHEDGGEYDEALPLHLRALAIREKALGSDHPEAALSRNNLARQYAARDRITTAIEIFERDTHIRARILARWLHMGSEHQRHRRMAWLTGHVHILVSLHLSMAPENARATRLALESILPYKSRVLDAMADTMRAAHLDADPDSRALLEQLRDAQAALAHLYLQNPGRNQESQRRYRRRRVELESRIDELQARLGARSETYRRMVEPISIAKVQARLSGDAALLELHVYVPFDFKATGQAAVNPWGEPRYAAYIVRPDGQVHGLDLGPARVIDEAVARLRESLAGYSVDANQRGRALDALVMQPVREHLGDAARVYVSPAGQLGFVPFGALVDEHGRYLVERYSFTYLASGRDLVQGPRSTDASARAAQPVTIVADPRYGVAMATDVPTDMSAGHGQDTVGKHRRSRDADRIGRAEALPGTRREAEILGALWKDSVVWTLDAASETAVKNVRAPRILHLATHGFFLADQDLETMADLSPDDMSLQSGIYGRLGVRGHRAPVENGLLRSGLLLAGANELRDPGGDNDGILTALEVSAMDLAGTRLVVLSACDTGLGAHGPDQGVYGLRRAFAIAGAETLIMSLWRVDDLATQDLMARYYRYLLDGEGRAEAMRRVQLDYLAQGGERAHPYHWASFVVSGDDSTLTGRPPRLATVPVRAGGCAGCNTGDAGPGGLWLCLLVLAAVSRVRRRERHAGRGRMGTMHAGHNKAPIDVGLTRPYA